MDEPTTHVAACRPVELDPGEPIDAMILQETFVWDGSTKAVCEKCRVWVWVGPRLQELMRTTLVEVLCLRCAAVLADEVGVEIRHLGNPQERPS